jgi:hypothetical protein
MWLLNRFHHAPSSLRRNSRPGFVIMASFRRFSERTDKANHVSVRKAASDDGIGAKEKEDYQKSKTATC